MTSPFRVTLNYRRHDTSGHAGRLYDALAEKFGSEHVFMDIDAIEPGVDFEEAIDRALASADAFICLIGTEWLGSTDAKGHRRLDNPEDFVRLEIEAALRREIRVIPVLVRGAEMPQSDELPESITGLARRNAIEIRDSSWHYDVGRLIRTLEKIDLEQVNAREPQAADRQPPMAEARKPRAAVPEPALAAEQAIPSRPPSGEPPASPLGVLARVRRFMTAHKLLAAGGVVALVAALLAVIPLLAAGGESVEMTELPPYTYSGKAHLDSRELTLQVAPALANDGPWELLLFNDLGDVRAPGTAQVRGSGPDGALEFKRGSAEAEAGGWMPWTSVNLPSSDHMYFGIAKPEAAGGSLALYAPVDDLH
jgi:hypothetical protein